MMSRAEAQGFLDGLADVGRGCADWPGEYADAYYRAVDAADEYRRANEDPDADPGEVRAMLDELSGALGEALVAVRG